MEVWRRAVRYSPGTGRTQLNLAAAYIEAGDHESAEETLARARGLEPENPKVFVNLGRLRRAQGRDAEAEEAYRRALALDPRDARARFNLANLLLARGDAAGAAAEYRRAAEQSAGPYHEMTAPSILSNWGIAELRLGHAKEAEALFRRALAKDPGLAEAHQNLGVALAGQDRHEEALAAYERAFALDAHAEGLNLEMGRVLEVMGRADEARLAYRREILLHPENPEAHYRLAVLLFAAGDVKGSVAALQGALQADAQYTPALEALQKMVEKGIVERKER